MEAQRTPHLESQWQWLPDCGQSAELLLLALINTNCDDASWLFTLEVSGTLKGPLAVSRYPPPCLLMGEVMLTLFELGSHVCVTSGPIVLLVFNTQRESLKWLLFRAGLT